MNLNAQNYSNTSTIVYKFSKRTSINLNYKSSKESNMMSISLKNTSNPLWSITTKEKPNSKKYSTNLNPNNNNYNYKTPKYSNSAVESPKSNNKSIKNNKSSNISNTPKKLTPPMFPPSYSIKTAPSWNNLSRLIKVKHVMPITTVSMDSASLNTVNTAQAMKKIKYKPKTLSQQLRVK